MKEKKFHISFFKYEIIKFIHIALILYLAFEIYNLIQWNFFTLPMKTLPQT